MKTFPVQMQTIDMQTGEVKKEAAAEFKIIPPHPDACQVCGRLPRHPEDMPHDALSLYYQYAFFGEHGRWPTWKDAMAHCPDEVRARWEQALKARDAWSEP